MKTIKFKILTKKGKNKTTGKAFTKRYTFYDFLNEDGTRTRKGIDVRFTENAFNKSQITEKQLKIGILEVDASCVGCPDKYEITKDENGKDVYPVVWVRDNGVVGYEEIKIEHEFHFAPVNDNEQDTNEVELSND